MQKMKLLNLILTCYYIDTKCQVYVHIFLLFHTKSHALGDYYISVLHHTENVFFLQKLSKRNQDYY